MRCYVSNLSYFDAHKYDTETKAIVKREGGTNLGLSHRYGYHHQPEVICFDISSPEHAKKIERVLKKELNNSWIDILEKAW